MDLFNVLLIVTTLFCALVTGLVYTFAVIVMPGIKNLNNHDYLNAFKVMDGVIQNNHPMFILVWAGSVVSIITLCVSSVFKFDLAEVWPIITATALYIVGVQAPTVRINIPINNALQSLNVNEMDTTEKAKLRERFETTWVKWNMRRTLVCAVVTTLLIYKAIQI